MNIIETTLLAIAVLGHTIFWVAAINRIHAWGVASMVIDSLTIVCGLSLLMLPAGLIMTDAVLGNGPTLAEALSVSVFQYGALTLAYGACCGLVAVFSVAARCVNMLRGFDSSGVVSNHTVTCDVVAALGHRPARATWPRLVTRLPGNQVFRLSIHEKTIHLSRLKPGLEGLKIAHLSDWHMSGRVERDFFEEVVARTNEGRPDLVAITGDLFDSNQCLDWIPQTLGRLRAPHGVYFVFGNHDLRIDHRRARHALCGRGLIDMGGRWDRVEIGGSSIVLAGNELPWFQPAARSDDGPESIEGTSPLRVLLSHSPDQINWARQWNFDLMLAGHTHGGQYCLPGIGPVLAPSRWGTKYASGTFDLPPTVMHVSRGISGLMPLRLNCPPELAFLVLSNGSK